MQTTLFLAKFFGIYCIISAVPILFCHSSFKERFNSMLESKGVMLMTGYLIIMLGIFLVLIHNIWTAHWSVIITIICWLTLLEGLMMIYCPKFSVTYFKGLMAKPICMAWAIFSIALGIFLVYQGFSL